MSGENKKSKEKQKLFAEYDLRRTIKINEDALKENDFRARSVTVGTAFGGASEIMLRRADGTVTFALLQPVEVIELIHQLSASIGCHIHIQPRRDFASWRDWKYTEGETQQRLGTKIDSNILPGGGGWAPHAQVKDEKYLTSLPPIQEQPGLQPTITEGNKTNEETVATQKIVGRKRSKRATTIT